MIIPGEPDRPGRLPQQPNIILFLSPAMACPNGETLRVLERFVSLFDAFVVQVNRDEKSSFSFDPRLADQDPRAGVPPTERENPTFRPTSILEISVPS